MTTAAQLEATARTVLENLNADPKSDWLWPHAADAEGLVYQDVFGGVFVGRNEIQPEIDNWS
jgi:hypothetical protein